MNKCLIKNVKYLDESNSIIKEFFKICEKECPCYIISSNLFFDMKNIQRLI
jgi:hypothetical protein